MSPEDIAARGARAELVELIAREQAAPPHERLAGSLGLTEAPGARAAAVLILFGVLDRIESTHAAEAVPRELDVLLLARAATLRSHPGQVAFPGGRLEPGDDGPVAAAVREAQEETGLDPSGVEVLGELGAVPLEYSSHLVTPVLAWWRRPSSVYAVDAAESAAVFRAPVADLLDPANRGTTVIRRGGQVWRGPGFLVRDDTGSRIVWGFTGMVLDRLFDLLGWTEPWDPRLEIPLEPTPDRGR